MASVTERIKGLLGSPQGRKLGQRGRQGTARARTQQKLREFTSRMTGGSTRRR